MGKNIIKKAIIMLMLGAFLFPFAVLAQGQRNQTVTIQNPIGEDSTIWTVVGRIMNWAFYISAFVAVIAIAVAAYMFLFSAGDPEKVKKARNLIIYAIIGVIVIFLSKSVVNLLLSILGSDARIP